jgi:transcriptional repressor NrdR
MVIPYCFSVSSILHRVNCPLCGSPTRVVETRSADAGAAVRRRRACVACDHRLTTYERVAADRLWVRKRSGERQRFDAAKLRAALAGAAHKRPVSGDDLDALVERVAAELERAGGELGAERIGELCLDGLAALDRGAYLQFAGTLPSSSPQFAAAEVALASAGSVRAPSEDV